MNLYFYHMGFVQICIILGVLLMLTATIGGGSEIVKEWHTYEFKDFW
jgi:hypothetical protein